MNEQLSVFSLGTPFVFECEPAFAQVGEQWFFAWLQCRTGEDRAVARCLGDGVIKVLSSKGDTAGPPQIAVGRAGAWVAWETCMRGRWGIAGSRWQRSWWEPEQRIAADAFDPALCVDSAGVVWCVYVDVASGGRELRLVRLDGAEGGPLEVPAMAARCYRPKLTAAGDAVWATWEAYTDEGYRVCACRVDGERPGDPVIVSDGPQSDVLHAACADGDGGLWLAWVNSQDVENASGVIDQWEEIHAGRLDGQTLERLPPVADLCQGMLVDTGPGGYLGRRRHPMLVADGDRMWVVWERKDITDGATREAAGVLCGAWFRGEGWSEEIEFCRGLLSYQVAPWASEGRLLFAARDATQRAFWNSRARNVFEAAWGTLVVGEVELNAFGTEFLPETCTEWRPVVLAERRQPAQRAEAAVRDETLSLFWGDPHVHTVHTGDAEGELDELLHYAQHKARLDFCAICDNDAYCLPLTDHAWARQQRLIEEHSEPGTFVVVPSYEWSWADPKTGEPNHRLVLYEKTGEAIFRHFEPGGRDIGALARSLEGTSGLLIGHHLGWVFAESDAEAAIEIVSAWSPHMAVAPEAIHAALGTGRRLGFTGGSDSHRRNPGFCGALTGVYAPELSAAAIAQAIRRRRTVATTGTMIGMEFWIGDAFIGDDVRLAGHVPVRVRARAPRPIRSLAVIRDGEVIAEQSDLSRLEAALEFDEGLAPGTHWYYARAVLHGDVPDFPGNFAVAEGSHAWTSPIWVTS